MFENYVGNLRPKVDVNLGEINKLLCIYKCKAQVKSTENHYESLLVKGVLQRHVFAEIINEAKDYIEKHVYTNFESNICKSTTILLNSLNEFSTTRDGANEITKTYPIKIRQQIYGFLGSLGFADIIKMMLKKSNPSYPI